MIMSSTNDRTYSYILIFITGGSNAKYVEIVKILNLLKIRSSKSNSVTESKTQNKIWKKNRQK